MAEARQPAYDDIRQVMNLTGVDEATARKELEETGGDMTRTINNLLDNLEVEVIEIVKAPATGEMEEKEGDTTRAIDRPLDLEAEVKVEKVGFF